MLLFALAFLACDPAVDDVVAADPPPTSARLLVSDPRGGAGPDVKRLVAREVAAGLSQYPAIEALAYSDLRRMIELQGEKQLTSCDEAAMTACLAELQSALGVPWAVFVDVDEVDGFLSIGITLLREDHSALARETLTVGDAAHLQAELELPLRRLVTPLHAALHIAMPPAAQPSVLRPALIGSGAVVVVVAVVVGVVGAAPWFAHQGARGELVTLRARAVDAPEQAPALLKEATVIQIDQRAALLAWNQYGQALVLGSAVGITLGVAAAVGGAFVE